MPGSIILIEGEKNSTDWATLNFISTTAHTVWGVMCGKIFNERKDIMKEDPVTSDCRVSGIIVGYAMDILNITPIIKRIATVSFIFVSGGWAILVLCFCYWLIDVKKLFLKGARFFIIVGMNSIFIYLFFSVGGSRLLYEIAEPFSKLFFSWGGELMVGVITGLMVWSAPLVYLLLAL